MATIDQQNTTGTDPFGIGPTASNSWFGQGVTAGITGTVNKIAITLAKEGTATGTLRAFIYGNTAGKPSTLISNGTGSTKDVSTCSAWPTKTEYEFTFAVEPIWLATLNYHLVIQYDGGTGQGDIMADASTNPYAGGVLNVGTNGSTWTTIAAADLLFKVYITVPSASGGSFLLKMI